MRNLLIVWMFIKYFFHPLSGSEDRGEESSNYDVPQSLSEREREGEREGGIWNLMPGAVYTVSTEYSQQSAISSPAIAF